MSNYQYRLLAHIATTEHAEKPPSRQLNPLILLGLPAVRTANFPNICRSWVQRIADELGFMVDHAVLLDQQIGQIAMQGAPFDPRALQGADRLRQELEGLHEFVQRLAETLGPDGICSPDIAADALKVRAQALRLRGLSPECGSDDLW